MSIQRTLQKCLDDWTKISGLDFCLLNADGSVYCSACSRQLPSPSRLEDFLGSSALCMANSDCCLYKVQEKGDLAYILIVWGSGESVPTIGELAVYQIESLLSETYLKTNNKAEVRSEALPFYKLKDNHKKDLWKDLLTENKDIFKDFEPLFTTIDSIFA